ncbi:MAG TPA: hypothetical protein VH115_08175 [Solirubrobacteraceae bacterium]|nr:hypothetical protein [Solirubrobacteraceae bacterium]
MSRDTTVPARNGKRPARAGRAALFTVHPHPGTRIGAPPPTFADTAPATDALAGQHVTLSLEDPDCNA